MTRKELLAEAKQLGIVGRNRMSKNDLAVAVNKKQHRRRDAEIVGNAQRAKARARAGTHTVTARRSSNLPAQAGLKAVVEAVSSSPSNRDDFAVGDVIRWVRSGTYTYAALKTPVGWFTTSRLSSNPYVPKVVSFGELLDCLSDPETSDVCVAAEWHQIQ